MNRNLIIVLVVALLILVGGIVYFTTKEPGSNNNVIINPIGTPNSPNPTPAPAPQATKPNVETSSTVSPSDTTAIVNGTVNPKGAFTSYWYEYGNDTDLDNKTTNQTIGSGFGSIQAPSYITGLVKNTTYYFRLVAENQYGSVVGTRYQFKTTEGTQPPIGSIPTVKSISANDISRTAGRLNGEVTPNKVTTQYWFEYGQTAQLGNASAPASAGKGDAKVSVSLPLSDLKPLTTYYFRINAQNQFGTVNGSILNFKTTGPTADTAPKVTSQNATQVNTTSAKLNGEINPNGAQTTYWFEYSDGTPVGGVLIDKTSKLTLNSSANPSNVSATISNLKTNTTYYFELVAENNIGTVRGDRLSFKTN